MLNNCILTGNLGADPEVFYSSDGDPVATFNQVIDHAGIIRGISPETAAVLACAFDIAAFYDYARDLAVFNLGQESGIFYLHAAGHLARGEIIENGHQHDGDDEPHDKVFG